MYIGLLEEDRSSAEQDDAADKLKRIEALLLKEGTTDISEDRKILTQTNPLKTIIFTKTEYQHSLRALDYEALLINTHTKSENILRPGEEDEGVFSYLKIFHNDEIILDGQRTKGGYHKVPFLFLTRTTIVQPQGWQLNGILNLEDAIGAMDDYLSTYQSSINPVENGYGWTDFRGQADFLNDTEFYQQLKKIP